MTRHCGGSAPLISRGSLLEARARSKPSSLVNASFRLNYLLLIDATLPMAKRAHPPHARVTLGSASVPRNDVPTRAVSQHGASSNLTIYQLMAEGKRGAPPVSRARIMRQISHAFPGGGGKDNARLLSHPLLH